MTAMDNIAGKLFGIRNNDRVQKIAKQRIGNAGNELARKFAEIYHANRAVAAGN